VESTAEVIEPFVTRFVKRVMRICLTITFVIVVLMLARAIVRSRKRRRGSDEHSPGEVDAVVTAVSGEALDPLQQEQQGDQRERAPRDQQEGEPASDPTEP